MKSELSAADSISLSSYIDEFLVLSLVKLEKLWAEWKGGPLWCPTHHLEHSNVPLDLNWRWTLQLAMLVIKMAKEWFGQWHFLKRAKTYTFKVIDACSFMAQKMEQIKPMPDFLSVTEGCEAHLIPCSMNPLEHVKGKYHHLGSSYSVHLLLTNFSTNLGYKKKCNPLDRCSFACDLRCTFGMAQLYNLVSESWESC